MNQRSGRRGRRGFSIPEVMSATTVMTMGFLMFGTAFPATGHAVNRGRHLDQAANACQKELDVYRQAGYNSLPAIPAGSSSVQVTFTPPSHLPNATGTLRFTRVNQSLAATTTDYRRVRADATITWSGPRSDHGSVTVTSLIVEAAL